MTTKIFAIRLVSSGEFQTYNGRTTWSKRGYAVNAFNKARPMFDNKDFQFYEANGVYQMWELTEIVAMYEGLCK